MLTNFECAVNFPNENNSGFLINSSAKTHVMATKKIKYEITRCTLIPLKIGKFGDSALRDVPCEYKTIRSIHRF
jgi:hypothetical protein